MVMSAKLSIIKAVYISPVRLHNNFVYKIISLHMKTGLACLAGTGSLVSHFQDSNRVPGQPVVHDVNWIPFPSKLFPVFACEYFCLAYISLQLAAIICKQLQYAQMHLL